MFHSCNFDVFWGCKANSFAGFRGQERTARGHRMQGGEASCGTLCGQSEIIWNHRHVDIHLRMCLHGMTHYDTYIHSTIDIIQWDWVAEWLRQPLWQSGWVVEWLSGCSIAIHPLRHSARVAGCSHSAALPEWLEQPLRQSGWVAASISRAVLQIHSTIIQVTVYSIMMYNVIYIHIQYRLWIIYTHVRACVRD